MKIKLRELLPIILSIIILSIFLVGLTRAVVTNSGSIVGLFKYYSNNPGWNYNFSLTGVSTSSGYRLDARNVYPTNFGGNDLTTTGYIIGKIGLFSGVGNLGDLYGNNLISTGFGKFTGLVKAGSIKIGSITIDKFGTVSGLIGPQGPQGPQGATGSIGATGGVIISIPWSNLVNKSKFLCSTGTYLQSFNLQSGTKTCISSITNGVCGISNGSGFTSIPTTNLCGSGSGTTVIDNGPGNVYTWSCNGINGGNSANCSANRLAIINGICGINSGSGFTSTPTTNLCSSGSGTTVIDNGTGTTYAWACNGINGGSNINCSTNHLAIIDGICGNSSGSGFTSIPTTSLCSSGSGTTVTDNGTGTTYTWACNGINGGINSSCSANNTNVGIINILFDQLNNNVYNCANCN